jgi:hypothetical protein
VKDKIAATCVDGTFTTSIFATSGKTGAQGGLSCLGNPGDPFNHSLPAPPP